MKGFQQQCIDLRKKDHTLNEIVKITGRAKSSVYSNIQGIPLSSKKQESIKENSRQFALKLAAERRGKSARKFKKFSRWNRSTVLFVAHFIFDGEIKHGGCVYNNRNTALLNMVEEAMKRIYNFPPRRYRDKVTGVFRISYFNVALASYMKIKAEELLKDITFMPKELQREFLRAFFDDEGCMDFRPSVNKRRVRGYQKNISVLKIVCVLLSKFNIDAFFQKPNEVVIARKENLLRFKKEINFSPGVRINGKRSNSIWKRSLEKRELLSRALSSFQT